MSTARFGSGFNEGIFEYRRDGQEIVGERSFQGPAQDVDAEMRLCFRYSKDGKVVWHAVSLQEREPLPARPVKVAVSWGWGGKDPAANLAHWTEFLDEAGKPRRPTLRCFPKCLTSRRPGLLLSRRAGIDRRSVGEVHVRPRRGNGKCTSAAASSGRQATWPSIRAPSL